MEATGRLQLRPSGEQTPEQARNTAVDAFRAWCDFEGIGTLSEEAVEAAVDVALAAQSAGTGSRQLKRTGSGARTDWVDSRTRPQAGGGQT